MYFWEDDQQNPSALSSTVVFSKMHIVLYWNALYCWVYVQNLQRLIFSTCTTSTNPRGSANIVLGETAKLTDRDVMPTDICHSFSEILLKNFKAKPACWFSNIFQEFVHIMIDIIDDSHDPSEFKIMLN